MEVRRNLFEAYLRPRETLVNLISFSANSSAAFPGGEAFRFAFSPHGRTLLALTSSRIFVLTLTADPITVQRELKTLRRPLSAAVTDDGSLLAVLSTKHQANIYGLTPSGVKHLQILVLDNPPRSIALAHEGTVLAAAYEGGVEVFSLAANALSTDRRAVRCEAVDSLGFSPDGSMLIGSSHDPTQPNAVVITAPFYTENDPNLSMREIHSRMWTTQILFPNNSSTCSHVALLPSHSEGDGNWLFAFDHTLRSYRAVRTDDTRSGVTYFLSPAISPRLSIPEPTIAPTASGGGDLVVAGFAGTGLWLYGIPEKVDTAPDMSSVVEKQEKRRHPMVLTSATVAEPLEAYSPPVSATMDFIEDDSLANKVDWRQSLFVKSRHLKSVEGLSAAQWVEGFETRRVGFLGKRLAVVAPGGVSAFAEDMGEEPMPVDGGRISLLDFDYGPGEWNSKVMTIEVGENEPELLPEQRGNHDVEVALARRRSLREASGRGGSSRKLPIGRSVTAIGSPSARLAAHIEEGLARNRVSPSTTPNEELVLDPTLESPFPLNQALSHDNLHRATTSAAVDRARYPPRPPLGTGHGIASGHIVYRRPDGRRGLPHESDADRWEPPPPPYSRSAQSAIQEHARIGQFHRVVTAPVQHVTEPIASPARASTTLDGMMTSEMPPSRTTASRYSIDPRFQRQRGLSESSRDTLMELAAAEQSARRAIDRADTQDSFSSPVSQWPTGNRQRRPISHDGVSSSEASLMLRSTLSHPMSPITPPTQSPEASMSPQSLNALMAAQSPIRMQSFSPVSAPMSPIEERYITLTGSNLQNRLNHPVPPTPAPTPYQHQPQVDHIPAALKAGQAAQQTRLSIGQMSKPFSLSPPTPSQVENLNRRMSQSSRRGPPSITISPHLGDDNFASWPSQSGGAPYHSASQDFAPTVPPSPPRAAWGAAGVPGSLSFNKARNSSRPLSRSDSRGGGRVIPISSSTPNLHAHPHSPRSYQSVQRPRYGRLDTIESVQSAYAEQTRSRSHSAIGAMGVLSEPRDLVILGIKDAQRRKDKKKRAKKEMSESTGSIMDGRGRNKREGRYSRCVLM